MDEIYNKIKKIVVIPVVDGPPNFFKDLWRHNHTMMCEAFLSGSIFFTLS